MATSDPPLLVIQTYKIPNEAHASLLLIINPKSCDHHVIYSGGDFHKSSNILDMKHTTLYLPDLLYSCYDISFLCRGMTLIFCPEAKDVF